MVYAAALLELAPLDDTLDWRKIAEGVVASAERQEYPDGEFVGLLPDSYNIVAQQRNPLNINPCATRLLRRKLDGLPTDVRVEVVEGRRVVSLPGWENGDVLIDGKSERR